MLLVVLRRLRYKLSLRDWAEMFLERGFAFTHETEVSELSAHRRKLAQVPLKSRLVDSPKMVILSPVRGVLTPPLGRAAGNHGGVRTDQRDPANPAPGARAHAPMGRPIGTAPPPAPAVTLAEGTPSASPAPAPVAAPTWQGEAAEAEDREEDADTPPRSGRQPLTP
jgi:hypothetical protein